MSRRGQRGLFVSSFIARLIWEIPWKARSGKSLPPVDHNLCFDLVFTFMRIEFKSTTDKVLFFLSILIVVIVAMKK